MSSDHTTPILRYCDRKILQEFDNFYPQVSRHFPCSVFPAITLSQTAMETWHLIMNGKLIVLKE